MKKEKTNMKKDMTIGNYKNRKWNKKNENLTRNFQDNEIIPWLTAQITTGESYSLFPLSPFLPSAVWSISSFFNLIIYTPSLNETHRAVSLITPTSCSSLIFLQVSRFTLSPIHPRYFAPALAHLSIYPPFPLQMRRQGKWPVPLPKSMMAGYVAIFLP